MLLNTLSIQVQQQKLEKIQTQIHRDLKTLMMKNSINLNNKRN